MSGGRVISFGEALWDLFPDGPRLGGAPLNFAYRIDSLGHQGIPVTRLGTDNLGDEALALVRSLGMSVDYISRDDGHPTGTVDITFDSEKNPSYVITPDVAYDYIATSDALLRLAASADALCFGTLAQRRRVSRATLLSMLDVFRGSYILYDVNLRRDCFTREIVKESLRRASIVKLNDEELQEVSTMIGLPGTTVEARSNALFAFSDTTYVIVTRGAGGAYVADRFGNEVDEPGHRIDLRDPCGAGDAFAAAFLVAVLEGAPISEACVRGNALGAMVAAQAGATEAVQRRELDAFLLERRTDPLGEGI